MVRKTHYVFDLDGTLANCDHRQDFALNKDWDTFHSLCHLDTMYEDVCELFHLLETHADFVMIVTGRDSAYRRQTEQWLHENGLYPDVILMRPEGNRDADHIMKLALVDEYFGSRQEAMDAIVCWFEDRDALVENLRNVGITVLQVKAGSY